MHLVITFTTCIIQSSEMWSPKEILTLLLISFAIKIQELNVEKSITIAPTPFLVGFNFKVKI